MPSCFRGPRAFDDKSGLGLPRKHGTQRKVENAVYLNRNQVLVASQADGLRKLCNDPDLSSATEIEISNVRLSGIPGELFAATRLKTLTITETNLKLISPRSKGLQRYENLSFQVIPWKPCRKKLGTFPNSKSLIFLEIGFVRFHPK